MIETAKRNAGRPDEKATGYEDGNTQSYTDERVKASPRTDWPIACVDLSRGGLTTLRDLALAAGILQRSAKGWAPSCAGLLPTGCMARTTGHQRHYLRLPAGEYLDIRRHGLEVFTVDTLPNDAFLGDCSQIPAFPSKLFAALADLRSPAPRSHHQPPKPQTGATTYGDKVCGTSGDVKLDRGDFNDFRESVGRRILKVCNQHRVQRIGTRLMATTRLARALYRIAPLRTWTAADLWERYLRRWWYKPSRENMRAGYCEARDSFADIWSRQNRGYLDPVEMAFEKSLGEPLPPAARRYRTLQMRRLVAICYILGANGWEFYLPCRKLGDALFIHYRDAARMLRQLVKDGVLYRAPTRDPGKAYRYVFIPQAAPMTADRLIVESLVNGPRLAKEMYALAEQQGITRRTLERAKSRLSVESRRMNGEWFWQLNHNESD